RAMVRIFYEVLWCAGPASANVNTQAMLALRAVDLRQGDGWKQLAAMPVCTSCHARLDYGMQFFAGFETPFHSVDFKPDSHRSGSGPLFGQSIDDGLGQAELTPHGFAELAVKHDRFARCMVHDVSEHVFQGRAEPEDTAAM